MAVVAALPKTWNSPVGVALTFVVAAPAGCDLRCAGCFIAQRKEAIGNARFEPDDYRRFIRDIAARELVSLASVQGYEPLLDDAWPSTRAVLETGREVGAETAVVTNGTGLRRHAAELASLGLRALTVSVDSADESIHDRIRGVRGAFVRTIDGIDAAMAEECLRTKLMVASVLRPNGVDCLKGMPQLLSTLGVDTWIVTPLLRVGRRDIGTPVAEPSAIVADLIALDAIARHHGVTLLADDEFDLALRNDRGSVVDFAGLRIRRLARRDGVFRLSPDGSLSIGEDILRTIQSDAVRWSAAEDPYAAILRARQRMLAMKGAFSRGRGQ